MDDGYNYSEVLYSKEEKSVEDDVDDWLCENEKAEGEKDEKDFVS